MFLISILLLLSFSTTVLTLSYVVCKNNTTWNSNMWYVGQAQQLKRQEQNRSHLPFCLALKSALIIQLRKSSTLKIFILSVPSPSISLLWCPGCLFLSSWFFSCSLWTWTWTWTVSCHEEAEQMQMREKMHYESGEAERRGVRKREGLAWVGVCMCVAVKQRLPEAKLKTWITQSDQQEWDTGEALRTE